MKNVKKVIDKCQAEIEFEKISKLEKKMKRVVDDEVKNKKEN